MESRKKTDTIYERLVMAGVFFFCKLCEAIIIKERKCVVKCNTAVI